MKESFAAVFGGLTVGAVLAACGSSNSNPAAVPCTPPAGVQVALIYPAPGSTAIPDAFSQVVIASSAALPATFDIALAYSTGGVLFGTLLPAPSPIPSPAATPPFSNPTYYTSNNPGYTFGAGTLLTAQVNDTGSACTPGTSLGSFTTQ